MSTGTKMKFGKNTFVNDYTYLFSMNEIFN